MILRGAAKRREEFEPGDSYIMMGRKKETSHGEMEARSASPSPSASAAAAAATITTSSGQVVTTSEFISHFDEATKKRLDRMSKRLRDLEMQMEALEAQVGKASDSCEWA